MYVKLCYYFKNVYIRKIIEYILLQDEFAATVEAWNELRAEAVTIALNKIVMPELRRELNAVLLQESKEYILK